MPVTFDDAFIDEWFWAFTYVKGKLHTLKVSKIFHILSTVDKKYDEIPDFNFALPEQNIMCEDSEILKKARHDFLYNNRELHLQLTNGVIVFNDSV